MSCVVTLGFDAFLPPDNGPARGSVTVSEAVYVVQDSGRVITTKPIKYGLDPTGTVTYTAEPSPAGTALEHAFSVEGFTGTFYFAIPDLPTADLGYLLENCNTDPSTLQPSDSAQAAWLLTLAQVQALADAASASATDASNSASDAAASDTDAQTQATNAATSASTAAAARDAILGTNEIWQTASAINNTTGQTTTVTLDAISGKTPAVGNNVVSYNAGSIDTLGRIASIVSGLSVTVTTLAAPYVDAATQAAASAASAAAALAAQNGMVTGGSVNGSGHLILTEVGGGTIDAGNVQGPAGDLIPVVQLGNLGATLDLSAYGSTPVRLVGTLTQNLTIANIPAAPASGLSSIVELRLIQTGTNAYTVTYSGDIRWAYSSTTTPAGVAHTMSAGLSTSAPASIFDLVFITRDQVDSFAVGVVAAQQVKQS